MRILIPKIIFALKKIVTKFQVYFNEDNLIKIIQRKRLFNPLL